jgi:formylglycine-generating enzyme required for sulfatase activity
VIGTPDPGTDDGTSDCNITTFAVAATGSRASCVSARGIFDMVGNLYEWVADWVPRSAACGSWPADVSPTGDLQCFAGAETTGPPGVLVRGGDFSSGPHSGPFSISGTGAPYSLSPIVGFRCAR